ncbi:major facilitator superfamily domain-containing protein [Lactarius sanguifluus]|nr:major facilitator superfamily domain-containing protein [Lactarius sanguifluus]
MPFAWRSGHEFSPTPMRESFQNAGNASISGVTPELHVSDVAALVGLTSFVAGYGLGRMVWSPLSEVPQIGRMPIYILTVAMFVVLQVPTALTTNYGFPVYGMSTYDLFATSAPSLGPLVGGFAVHVEGWRWTIWEVMWLSGATLVLLFFFFPETSAANILYRRARRLRKATGNPSVKLASEIAAAAMTPRDVTVDVPPIVLILNVYVALICALLYIFFESFPIVFVDIYHWREQMMFGLSFLGIFVGTFVIILPFFAYLYFVQEPKYNDKGELKPKKRMPAAIVGALILPVCLFWLGWTSRASVHWIVPIIGPSLFGIAARLLFNAGLNYLADAYSAYAASVLAGNDCIRSMFWAGFPLFAGAMYRNLGVGQASTVLALLACTFVPIPSLLYKYGEHTRTFGRLASAPPPRLQRRLDMPLHVHRTSDFSATLTQRSVYARMVFTTKSLEHLLSIYPALCWDCLTTPA